MIIYLKCYTCNKLIYIDLATPENRKELRIVKFDSGATIHITYTVKSNEMIRKKEKKGNSQLLARINLLVNYLIGDSTSARWQWCVVPGSFRRAVRMLGRYFFQRFNGEIHIFSPPGYLMK